MSVKRLALPLCAVLSLLAIAGILEVVLLVYSGTTEAVAAEAPQLAGAVEKVLRPQLTTTQLVTLESEQIAYAAADAGSIVVDGNPIDRAEADELAHSAVEGTKDVQFIDQRAVLPSGCELVALTVALRAEGYELSDTEIADKFLRKGSNVATDYLGDPAKNGGGLPPCIVDAANAWAADRKLSVHAHNLTGTSMVGVKTLTELGYPVVVWTTEKLRDPYNSGSAVDGWQWYRPEHCVVVYGFEGEEVLVSDSLEGLVRRNLADFQRIYEACGSKAVLVQPE